MNAMKTVTTPHEIMMRAIQRRALQRSAISAPGISNRK